MNAAAELQRAIYDALAGNAALVALLGGQKVLDRTPANVAFPYITFGKVSSFDWSTATEDGAEHLVTLHVWSKAKGKAEALAILARVRALLHDAALALQESVLVNLRCEFAELSFDDEHGVYHGVMRVRGMTEQ